MTKSKKISQILIKFASELTKCKDSCILVLNLLNVTEKEIRQIIKQEKCPYCRGTGKVVYSLKKGRVIKSCPNCKG